MTETPHTTATPLDYSAPGGEAVTRIDWHRLVTGYFWFILKNVIGWTLIIAAPILGIALPGPGGIPVFLIGFALVTFPGKRRITTRFMRGRRLPVESPLFTGLITFFSVLVTVTLMLLVWRYYDWIGSRVPLQEWGLGKVAELVAISLLALPVTMIVSWVGLKVLNGILSWVPRMRRMIRPALRKWGVRLLPARRRLVGGETHVVSSDEILSLDELQRRRLQRSWATFGPYLQRLATVSLTLGIIWFLVVPVLQAWNSIESRIATVNFLQLSLGVALFAAGLLVFRAGGWRTILRLVGDPLPVRAAARIWCLSHLARYVPGRFYEIMRMEMARPYGPSSVETSIATRLEGALTLIAALMVGLVAFWILGYQRLPEYLRPILIFLAALSPIALVVTAPSIFYRLMPPRTGTWRRSSERTRLHGPWVLGLFLWFAGGVLWQSLAVWLLVGPPLGLASRWWIVAGAWSLGWAAGHLAPWAPGGLGVREIVFVGALSVLLPPELRDSFAASMPFTLFSPESWQDVWWAFLFFLSLLLRLATTAAEFLIAAVATLFDWSGMVRQMRTPSTS